MGPANPCVIDGMQSLSSIFDARSLLYGKLFLQHLLLDSVRRVESGVIDGMQSLRSRSLTLDSLLYGKLFLQHLLWDPVGRGSAIGKVFQPPQTFWYLDQPSLGVFPSER